MRNTQKARGLAGFLFAAAIASSFTGCLTSDWKAAQQKDSVESYRAFLARHPSSEYTDAARQKYQWKEAQQKDNVGSYSDFLAKYPYSVYSETARERMESLKESAAAAALLKPDWHADGFSDVARPKSVGVLVINYESDLVVDGEPSKELNPKLDTRIARTNLAEWLSYKPYVAGGSGAQLVTKSIVEQVKSIDAGQMVLKATALLAGQTVREGLEQFKNEDMVLVLAISGARASVTSLTVDRDIFASVFMHMDFVLLSRDRRPVMSYRAASLQRLDTIGELDLGYAKAEPFKGKVSFRYSLQALVGVTAPVVVGVVKTQFLSDLLKLRKQGLGDRGAQ